MLTTFLRPHQREGVQFMFECVAGLKDFEGQGISSRLESILGSPEPAHTYGNCQTQEKVFSCRHTDCC